MIPWFLAIIFLVLSATPASAQETMTLSDEQLEYNNLGVRLLSQGEHEEAIDAFRSSLALGESNITWLNLGRAYQRADRCMEARQAYAKVRTSPAVRTPSVDEIAEVVLRYEQELPSPCPSTITVRCPDATAFRINEELAACQTFSLPPGDYHVQAQWDETIVEMSLRLEEGENREIVMERGVEPVEVIQPPVAPPAAVAKPGRVHLYFFAAGGLILSTALVLDLTWVKSAHDEVAQYAAGTPERQDTELVLQTRQLINRVIIGAGAGAVAIGVISFLLRPKPTAVGVEFSDHAVSLRYTVHW